MIKFPIQCKSTKEKSFTLEDYYKTLHFKNVIQNYRKSSLPKKCFICEKKERLTFVHKTYKNLGNEKNEDLICLCFSHHQTAREAILLSKGKNVSMWDVLLKLKKRYKEQPNNPNEFLWW